MLFNFIIFSLLALSSVQATRDLPLPARHRQRSARLAARTSANPDWSYTSCITDSQSMRALNGPTTTSGTNTPDQCIDKCENVGYNLAGVSYGNQCWCGNAVSAAGKTVSSSECDYACAGDKNQKCGGFWRISLYTKYTPRSLGCFVDQTSPRTLPVVGPDTASLTTEMCQSYCAGKGYSFAGTSYSRQCWCSDTAPAANKAAPSSECSYKCGGNSAQICGGNWRLSVYDVSGAPTTSPSPPSTSTTKPSTTTSKMTTSTKPPSTSAPQPTTSGYVGCFTDTSSPRTLPTAGPDTASMTTEMCLNYCSGQGYSYAGTSYSRQCWCSKVAPVAGRTAPEADCSYKCGGNSGQICGGNWRLSVYGVDAFASPITTKPSTTSRAASTAPASTASTAPGAGVTEAGGSVAPGSSAKKFVFAHHMVGNTYSYNQATWASDIAMAAGAGIDGFALNVGSDAWGWARVVDAYAAAKAFGPSFKLFFSFDMNSFSCGSPGDGANLAKWISEYSKHPNQAFVEGKQLASTFSGGACFFGQGSVNDGWNTQFRSPLAAQGINLTFVPSSFSDPSTFSASWQDGNFAWNAAWPMGGADLDTSEDRRQMAALGSKTYMAAISPAFFTYYSPSSYNKNWIYRGDNWLLATRFEDVIAMRDQIDLVELITWNDYGESHYLGPIRADQPNSQGWTNGMPHTAWLKIVSYYANVFKTGSYNTPSSDSLILWTRPHPKSASPSNPSMGRPTGADNTDDNLYAVAMLKSAATVTINSGSSAQTWNLPAGVTKLRISSASGAIGGKIVRGGSTVADYDSTGEFSYTLSPVDYNFNYFVAST